jgi:predicted RNA-binding Zn-ribbon protein involved in translation (DUF1610 family)
VTAVQLADRVKTEVDAAPAPTTGTGTAAEPCPDCGDTDSARRHETRRVPNPCGGRGATMARVTLCGACGTAIGRG